MWHKKIVLRCSLAKIFRSMLRNIRPHSLGIVAAAVARPNDTQTSSTQDISNNASNDSVGSKAKAAAKQESLLTTRNPNVSESDEERRTNNGLQTTTTCERKGADAENGFENASTNSKFEVCMFKACMHAVITK